MKFESISVRESSVEHFGKRGMGWHGFAIMYHLWENNQKTINMLPKDILCT